MPFNAFTNLTRITGNKGEPELEQRVERCAERGYMEVGRSTSTSVGKVFDDRGRFRYTEEFVKETVYMRKIEKETKQ